MRVQPIRFLRHGGIAFGSIMAVAVGIVWLAGDAPAAQAQTSTNVSIIGNQFNPARITVAPGTRVTWTNNDGVAHNATSVMRGVFATTNLGSGVSSTITFSQTGTFEYECTIHPSMRGTVTVQSAAPQPTFVPVPTSTPVPSSSPSPEPSATPAPAPTAQPSASPSPSAMPTPSPSASPSPAASPTPSAGRFGPFATEWTRRGFSLRVEPDGTASASWRVYRWCADDPTPPCDALNGSEIVSGGMATLAFTEVDGTVVTGEALTSTDAKTLATQPDGGTVSLLVLTNGIAILTQGSNATVLCNAEFRNAPRAVQMAFPCGA